MDEIQCKLKQVHAACSQFSSLVLSHGLLCRLRCWQVVAVRRIFRSPRAGVGHHAAIDFDHRAITGQMSIERASRGKRLVCALVQVEGQRPNSRSETMWENMERLSGGIGRVSTHQTSWSKECKARRRPDNDARHLRGTPRVTSGVKRGNEDCEEAGTRAMGS